MNKLQKKIYNCNYRKKHKREIIIKSKRYYKNHKEQYQKRSKKYYQKHKEKIIHQTKQYQMVNKSKISKAHKIYWYKNRKKFAIRKKIYYIKNKKQIIRKSKNYILKKRKIDINFKLKEQLRSRLYKALKGNPKLETTMELIGCSIEKFRQHLESKFTKGMSWQNYGKWHIDHIKPCASFNLSKPEEQRKCFNYKNLQPLWAKDNLEKSNKI
jgi:hypothetical protein